ENVVAAEANGFVGHHFAGHDRLVTHLAALGLLNSP
ncbi:MAG: hypothetical protein RIS17_1144, partial [Pseudomonadota bacterium]